MTVHGIEANGQEMLRTAVKGKSMGGPEKETYNG